MSLIKRARAQLGASTYLFATVVVILAGMLVSYLVASNQNTTFNNRADEFLSTNAIRIEEDINRRMQSYGQLLTSGATLFNINGTVTRNQWRDFVQGLQVQARYPGTLGVGFAEYIGSDLATHEARIRASGFPDYQVTPPGTRNEYTAIIYLEPFNEQNQRAFGYDMFSEPERREAMVFARDNGQHGLSAPVTLVQEENETSDEPGILLYVPVYGMGKVPDSVNQRRDQLLGYSYAVLRTNDMFDPLLQEYLDDPRLDLAIVDEAEGKPIFVSGGYKFTDNTDDFKHATRTFDEFNRAWQVNVQLNSDEFRAGAITPPWVFAIGSMVSVFIGAFLFILMLNRLGRIAVEHEVELQKTKDELLVLASHQLRTPASGVKQYIGMVLQGYAGKVTREQQHMLERAFEANDRQLEIINQLLYVAKADAGQLRIEKESFDFTNMVKEVVDGYADMARDQKVEVKAGRLKRVRIRADKRYMRMIVENLISNAIKYSYQKGTVRLKIEIKGRRLIFTVTDKGVGIKAEDMPKLFEKFARIDNELSRQAGGSGIGLYLAKELANAHDGEITAESEPGKGSTFRLEVPNVVIRRRTRRRKPS